MLNCAVPCHFFPPAAGSEARFIRLSLMVEDVCLEAKPWPTGPNWSPAFDGVQARTPCGLCRACGHSKLGWRELCMLARLQLKQGRSVTQQPNKGLSRGLVWSAGGAGHPGPRGAGPGRGDPAHRGHCPRDRHPRRHHRGTAPLPLALDAVLLCCACTYVTLLDPA